MLANHYHNYNKVRRAYAMDVMESCEQLNVIYTDFNKASNFKGTISVFYYKSFMQSVFTRFFIAACLWAAMLVLFFSLYSLTIFRELLFHTNAA